jgi:hypothetical protein
MLTIHILWKFFFTYICPTFYGGGPSTPANTTQTQNVNRIPAELMPYAIDTLNTAQHQLFNVDDKGKISGIKPFTPYSTNGKDYVAPFSSLQTRAQQGAGALQTPGQFQPATAMTRQGGIDALSAGNRFASQVTNPNSIRSYMSPYMQNVVNQQVREANRDFDITRSQEMGQAAQNGAFGGSREAIMAAENERNRNTKLADIQATGLQSAFQNAQAQQQYAADVGLRGEGQAVQAGQALGQLGTSQLAAQQGVIGTQNEIGGMQQEQNQKAIDAAVLNYQNEQQQPYKSLGFMSNLVSQTPMNDVTTMQYQRQPGMLQQGLGALGAGISAYNGMKAKGGLVKSKDYAGGGIVAFSVGGKVKSELYDMSASELKETIDSTSSPKIKEMASEILAKKVPAYASGGIVDPEKLRELQSEMPPEDTTIQQLRAQSTAREAKNAGIQSKLAGINTQTQSGKPSGIATTLPTAPTPASSQDPVEYLQSMGDKTQQQANRPVQDIINEKKAVEEANGLGENEAIAERRKAVMSERANEKDENTRQNWLRMAEFFANWGSTPGPPLVAAMKSLKETLPGIYEDKKQQKAAHKAMDDILYELNMAEHAEKKGDVDEAIARKEKASWYGATKHSELILDAMQKKQQLEAQQQMNAEDNRSRETAASIAAEARSKGGGAGVSVERLGQLKRIDAKVKELSDRLISAPEQEKATLQTQLDALYREQKALNSASKAAILGEGYTEDEEDTGGFIKKPPPPEGYSIYRSHLQKSAQQ